MAFEHIGHLPPDDQFIHPKCKLGAGSELPTIPPAKLLTTELSYWHGQLVGSPESDNFGYHPVQHLTHDLEGLVAEHSTITAMQEGKIPFEHELFQKWYGLGSSVLAFCRLLRELPLANTSRGHVKVVVLGTDDPTFLWNFDHTDLERSALHAKREGIMDVELQLPKLGQAIWHEGENIYVRTSYPAHPTSNFRRTYANKLHRKFEPRHFISIIPRLKASAWTQSEESNIARGAPVIINTGEKPPSESPDLKSLTAEAHDILQSHENLLKPWQLTNKIRTTLGLDEINKILVRGDASPDQNWQIVGVNKETARQMLGILRWITTALEEKSPNEVMEEGTAVLNREQQLLDRLQELSATPKIRVPKPERILADGMKALLYRRDQTTPQWSDLEKMFKNHWPDPEHKINWETIGEILQYLYRTTREQA